MVAQVLSGSRNLFILALEGSAQVVEGRIKGKILKEREGFYNPLAPGDRVEIEGNPPWEQGCQIVGLLPRKNHFCRFNQKGQAPQLLGANMDWVFCVSTPGSPPFRPRFIDRVLVQADHEGIPVALVLNKMDLGEEDPDMDERLEDYRRLGYPVFRLSVKTGEGLDSLRSAMGGCFSLLVGQSGVGKTSLLNALGGTSSLQRRVGALCTKYDRGRHTTTMAELVEFPSPKGPSFVVDTPGLRKLLPYGINSQDAELSWREFQGLVGQCTFGLSCSHLVEPGCKILEAVHAGVIHEDRYESFVRLREELREAGL